MPRHAPKGDTHGLVPFPAKLHRSQRSAAAKVELVNKLELKTCMMLLAAVSLSNTAKSKERSLNVHMILEIAESQ